MKLGSPFGAGNSKDEDSESLLTTILDFFYIFSSFSVCFDEE